MASSWYRNLEKWQRGLVDASWISGLTEEEKNDDVHHAVHIGDSDESYLLWSNISEVLQFLSYERPSHISAGVQMARFPHLALLPHANVIAVALMDYWCNNNIQMKCRWSRWDGQPYSSLFLFEHAWEAIEKDKWKDRSSFERSIACHVHRSNAVPADTEVFELLFYIPKATKTKPFMLGDRVSVILHWKPCNQLRKRLELQDTPTLIWQPCPLPTSEARQPTTTPAPLSSLSLIEAPKAVMKKPTPDQCEQMNGGRSHTGDHRIIDLVVHPATQAALRPCWDAQNKGPSKPQIARYFQHERDVEIRTIVELAEHLQRLMGRSKVLQRWGDVKEKEDAQLHKQNGKNDERDDESSGNSITASIE